MGALFSSLKGGSPEVIPVDLAVNLLNPQPNSGEAKIYEELALKLQPAPELLRLFKGYKGCGEAIREAISKPTDESNLNVWKALQTPINISIKIYNYSIILDEILTRLLEQLLKDNNVNATLEANQATAKLFIQTLSFISEFDEIKTLNSDIQNDFSFYRRSISKFKMMDKQFEKDDIIVSDEVANHMSLFLAHHAPMFNTLSQAINKFNQKNSEAKERCTSLFSGLSGVCYHTLSKGRGTSEEKNDLLRSMVICSVLYDQHKPGGMFIKGSSLDIKPVIRMIQTYGGSSIEPLMNSLRFNMTHLNDKTTPKQIRALLGVS